MFIDPVKELGGLLLNVDKPGRYTGGETGILSNTEEKKSAVLKTLIAFPDLYEIGMGNQALRIIYNRLNSVQNIMCDRAFAPAPDFEKLLREKKIPLYGLDTGLALFSFDLLLFTIGYELGLAGVFLMLDVSGIPLRCAQRGEEHPLIIAGGPAVSNPLPFSEFIDAFWIGEAEAGFFDLAEELAQIKKSGKGRAALLEKISSNANVWVKGKEKAVRAVHSGFSSDDTEAAVYPIPSMKIVHNHGSAEIMRGCPNGCRFCHAGFWYRPMRQKSIEKISIDVKQMIEKGGWQKISLSSLSSGDYENVSDLLDALNNKYAPLNTSFQMPSLKVSGFSLGLLEKISVTRKSGLTFAVETPVDAWQLSINKEVTRDSVVEILNEAKKRGWKGAKFYFMIGLPLPEENTVGKIEEDEIINFVIDAAKKTRMHFNINIGIFVPKPHTPFQYAPQIDSFTARKKSEKIIAALKPAGHKVSFSDTLISRIEGLLSRGDERAGLLFEEAYLGGSRLDSWSEYIDSPLWEKILNENEETVNKFLLSEYEKDEKYPWEVINSCVSREYYDSEFERSLNSVSTSKCTENCVKCGVCNNNVNVTKNTIFTEQGISVNHKEKEVNKKKDPGVYKLIFSFCKLGSAVFHGHLSLIEIFSMALRRTGIPVIYSQGFNPLIKMEFASSLTTGISADCEIASVSFYEKISFNEYLPDINLSLPQGIKINESQIYYIPGGAKKHSLPSLLWGFLYANNNIFDYVPAKEEKIYREKRIENYPDKRAALINLNRAEVLAKNLNDENGYASYFDVYRSLYPL